MVKAEWKGSAGDLIPLEQELRAKVRGEVRFDKASRALYSTDSSNYRQIPIGLVLPSGPEDVVETVAACRRFGAPILSRGGGVSLAGQTCNTAVVLDFSKYLNRVLELDPAKKIARVQPGIVLDDLRDAAERYHLTFAPDPATHTHCTLGGMIGNNSCGVHSVMGGKTDDNVEELEILTYDGLRLRVGRPGEKELRERIESGGREGEIYARLKALADRYRSLIRKRYPDIPRRVSGYNLVHLLPEKGFHVARSLVGSEGTCVVVLEARLRLVPSPPGRSLLVLGYPDVYTAGDHIMEVLDHGPIGLEGIDDTLVKDLKKKNLHPEGLRILPEGGGWLLAEFGGETRAESDERARALMKKLARARNAPSMKLFDDPQEEKIVWKVRESGLGATARIPGEKDTWEGWEDSGVPPEKLGNYLRELRGLLNRHGYKCSLYGHFGQGCVHTRIDFDFLTREGIEKYRAFIYDAADLVLGFGGSLSGEHGDGQSRAELLPKMFGPELVEGFREFKSIWDPAGKMNPGKLVDPYRIDENLRFGTDYHPRRLATHFSFSEDRNSFSYATERCVGVGECRKERHGIMCPSYMGTRDELDSTRGRARALFEMFRGDFLQEGWREEAVKKSLDLCLSCKGCKSECPMNVDMAMYKAEFLSHYYQGRLRPLDAYSMGLIYWWCRVASRMPRLVNFFMQTSPLSKAIKSLSGISTRREFPYFVDRTFKDWFARREPRNGDGREVILWPDTFNNYFHPEIARAALEVLESSGFRVRVPTQPLCCGRPLFDYGMLNLAKRLLREVMEALGPEIDRGVPLVGLEPACVTTFRDELPALFPGDGTAEKLSRQSFILSEFLEKEAPDFPAAKLRRQALVQGHCNHHSVLKMDAEKKILSRLGLDYRLLDSGCCGVSGAFGFRKKNYELSLKIGERVLLPEVRKASRDTLIIADGFACGLQISQATERRPLHLAQVLCMAMHNGGTGDDFDPEGAGPVPNRGTGRHRKTRPDLPLWGWGLGGGALVASILAIRRARREARESGPGRRRNSP